MRRLAPGDKPALTLVTTGRAPEGSAASLLRADGERDELSALRKLRALVSVGHEIAAAQLRDPQ